MQVQDELIPWDEAAKRAHRSVAAFYAMRHRGFGPKAIRLGRKLVVRESDFEAWLRENEDRARPGP